VASDDFIARTLITGRPNRRMPALAAPGASLDPTAVTGLISFLREQLGSSPALRDLIALAPDPALGDRMYRDECASCHGAAGEGTPLGSPLAAADRVLTPERAYEATVRGVPNTAMPAYGSRPPEALAAVLRHIQALPRTGASRTTWIQSGGLTASADRGADLYGRICIGCHGPNGEGRVGPALANPAFREAASTDFIAATVMRGRSGTPMPSFGRDNVGYPRLTAPEVLDITAFIRERLGTAPPAQGVQ
jgi:mono/diheme cytochrome c family protein